MAAGDEGTGPTPHEDADQASRQDLLRGLRHELRTPINHIVGYSELLLDVAEERGARRAAGRPRQDPRGRRRACRASSTSRWTPPGSRAALPDTELAQPRGSRTPAEHDRRVQRAAGRGGRGGRVRRSSAGPPAHPHGRAPPARAGSRPARPGGRHRRAASLDEAGPATGGARHERRHRSAPRPDEAAGAEPRRAPDIEVAKLLVVDDDEANRDMLSRRLERLGYARGAGRGRPDRARPDRRDSRST